MCFFDQTRWACGSWRWGTFRQQCAQEYRIGETCGLRLVWETRYESAHCRDCDVVLRKRRRAQKMTADLDRWRRQGDRPATVEKTERDLAELRDAIAALVRRHHFLASERL